MEFGSESGGNFIQTYNRTSSAYGYLRFITNGETMRLTNAGNVGIGTSSPTSRVDIRSPNGVTHSRGQLYLTNTDTAGINKGSQISLGGTYSGTGDTYFASIAGRKENATSADYDGYLQFATRTNGGSNVERMRINSSGNVGIGTTSPTNTDYGSLNPKLHVKQSNTTGAFNLVARFEAGGDANETGGAILINHSNDRGMLIEGGRDGSGSAADDDAVGHLGILNSGGAHTRMITLRQNMVGASNVYNVGIGTTAPAAKLQVEELGIDTTTTSTAAVTQVAIDSMVAATFRSARYTIQVTNSTDSTYHLTEMLLIHDGTTPSISEFGTIFTGSAAEAAFTADINSGNVRILATPASTDAMAFKVVRHSITV
jgi:hypothetical protein